MSRVGRWAGVGLLLIPPLLSGGCPPASGPGKPATRPASPGIALRFEGVDVDRAHIEEFVPYVQGFRPGQAPDAIRRHILLRHAIPLAWGLARHPEAFERARVVAEGWLAELRTGGLTLEELARRRAVEEGAAPDAAAPITSGRTSLPLPLSRAAFEARPGEIVGPIRTALGWHLLRVDRIEPGLVREADLVTFLQVVSPAGGKEQLEEVRRLGFRLGEARASVELLDPDYSGVVPAYLLKNRPGGEVAPTAAGPDR